MLSAVLISPSAFLSSDEATGQYAYIRLLYCTYTTCSSPLCPSALGHEYNSQNSASKTRSSTSTSRFAQQDLQYSLSPCITLAACSHRSFASVFTRGSSGIIFRSSLPPTVHTSANRSLNDSVRCGVCITANLIASLMFLSLRERTSRLKCWRRHISYRSIRFRVMMWPTQSLCFLADFSSWFNRVRRVVNVELRPSWSPMLSGE